MKHEYGTLAKWYWQGKMILSPYVRGRSSVSPSTYIYVHVRQINFFPDACAVHPWRVKRWKKTIIISDTLWKGQVCQKEMFSGDLHSWLQSMKTHLFSKALRTDSAALRLQILRVCNSNSIGVLYSFLCLFMGTYTTYSLKNVLV
jgi:hypothetical protein